MTAINGVKQTPPTPPTTTDEESSGSTDDGEAKKKKGNRAMGKKKYTKALRYYSRAIKIDPANATYRLNRAIANAALELWKDAEADAGEAVELGDPPSAKSHFQLARARLRRGRLDEAKEALKAGLALCPDEAALLQLGRELERHLAAREQKRKEAEAAARPPVIAGPSGAQALLEQARAAYDAGRSEEAVRLCREARSATHAGAAGVTEEAKREQISILSLQGKASMRLRLWADAAEALQGVVEVEETLFSMDNKDEREALSNAYNNLGIALKNAGRLRQAVDALSTAYMRATNGDDKVATPQAAQILQNIAQCLRAERKFGEASQMYARALDIGQRLFSPDHATHALNYMGMGRCLRDEGRIKEAIESYTRSVEIWMRKDADTCMAEIPEVPSKERLRDLQQQCHAELGQLVVMVEKARQAALLGQGPGQGPGQGQGSGVSPEGMPGAAAAQATSAPASSSSP